MTTFWQLIPNNSHWTRLKIRAWKPTGAKETGNVSTWRTAAPRCEEPVEVTAPLLWKCSSVTERRPRDPGADSLEGTVSQLTCEAQVELKGMNGACVSAVILYSDAAPIRAQTSCIEDVALSDKLTIKLISYTFIVEDLIPRCLCPRVFVSLSKKLNPQLLSLFQQKGICQMVISLLFYVCVEAAPIKDLTLFHTGLTAWFFSPKETVRDASCSLSNRFLNSEHLCFGEI